MTRRKAVARHIDEVVPVECPCGMSSRILTSADGGAIGLHVTDLGGARRHYHQRTSEVYYILEGEGELELGSEIVSVRPGHAVLIPPGVPHRAIGRMKAVICCAPPFDPEDEHLCE